MSIVSFIFGKRFITRGFALTKRNDYSNKDHNERVYYQILDDAIFQMRGRVGDDALVVAETVKGLSIDRESGEVLDIKETPSTILQTLMLRYETLLGQRLNYQAEMIHMVKTA